MVHPKVNTNARYSALLSISNSNLFFSRSMRGLKALAHITEITYGKQESGLIKVRIFLKENTSQKDVADILHGNDFKAFGFKPLNKPRKK